MNNPPSGKNANTSSARSGLLAAAALTTAVVFALFLVATHFVKCYSDPTGWISMAENFYLRGLVPRWSATYAAYLYWPLQWLGLQYVYISNLPWLILLFLLLPGATYRCINAGDDESRLRASRVFVWVLLIMIWFSCDLSREVLNPYREAFTFSFLAAAFYILPGRRRQPAYGRTVLAGAMFGFSTAVREPHLLAIVSLMLMLFAMLYERMPSGGWRHFPVFIAGMLAGMTPFFVQNAMFSGYWWVPSYLWDGLGETIQATEWLHPYLILKPMFLSAVAALLIIEFIVWRNFRRQLVVTTEQMRRRWLVSLAVLVVVFIAGVTALMLMNVVPAMDRARFLKTGQGTINHLNGKWGGIGLTLLLVGLVDLVLRREKLLALMTIPSALIFMAFWCMYNYVKERYVFGVEFFVYPIMGLGAHRLVFLPALLFASSRNRERLQNAGVLIAAAATCGWMIYLSATAGYGMKVWHLTANKEAMTPRLEKPFVIDCGHRHYGQALATTLGDRFTDVHQHHRKLFYWDAQTAGTNSVDESYRQLSGKVFDALAGKNIYDYGVNRRYLVRFWLDSVPVMNLSDLPHPIIVYGRKLEEPLYQLKRWENPRFVFEPRNTDGHEPLLLGFDLLRLWDYPERTFCRIDAGTTQIEPAGQNHFQWAALPDGISERKVVFESDAGLPAEPFVHAFRLNDEITVSLGCRSEYWYRNYLSEEFLDPQLIHEGAALLLSEGEVQVPVFAGPDREAYARFHYSYYPGELADSHEQRLEITCNDETTDASVPGKNQSADVVVRLGDGTGAFDLATVGFRRHIDDVGAHKFKKRKSMERYGYVKVHQFHVWYLPRRITDALDVTAGPEYQPWRIRGFYPSERGPYGSFAWMQPEAELQFPPVDGAATVALRVTLLDERPGNFPTTPSWRWNGTAVEPTGVRVKENGKVAEYSFASLTCASGERNKLQVFTDEWVPARDSGIKDPRSLGLCLLGARIEPK